MDYIQKNQLVLTLADYVIENFIKTEVWNMIDTNTKSNIINAIKDDIKEIITSYKL